MKKTTLNILFVIILILGCLSVLVGFQNVRAYQNQAFGFTTLGSVDEWEINYSGYGNHGTLTANEEFGDPFATLTCDSYSDPDGWVGITHSLSPLTVGAEYTLSFWYESSASMTMQFFSADDSWNMLQQEYSWNNPVFEWTHRTFTFTVQDNDAVHFWLSVNIYGVGYVNVDEIDLSLTDMPTPVPTNTPPTPTPMPTASPPPTVYPSSTPTPPIIFNNGAYFMVGFSMIGVGSVGVVGANAKSEWFKTKKKKK